MRVCVSSAESRCNPERTLDKPDLANDIVFGYPADLTFADDVHGLVSRNRVQRAIDGSEPLASHDPLLDETMILLKDVVEVGCPSTPAPQTKFTSAFQLLDGRRVRRMAIHVDHARAELAHLPQCKLEKAFSGNQVALWR